MIVFDIFIIFMSLTGLLLMLRQIIMNIISNRKPIYSYPDANEESMAVVVCCRNEEEVIGRLLEALNNQEYGNYRVFVVAHNCTDNTASISKEYGVEVIEYDAPDKNRKADALNKAMEHIRNYYPNEFEYITVFDADSLPNTNFLKKINNAMASGCDVASGTYDYLNYSTSLVSKLCAGLYMVLMKTDSLASFQNNLPVNVYGSGFCVRYELVKNGWNTKSLVEDFELVVREVLNGKKFTFVPDAVFKSEMPCKLSAALKQRLRWSIGDTQCSKIYFKAYLKSLRHPTKDIVKQFFEMCINQISLVTVLSILLIIVKAIITKTLFGWSIFLAVEFLALYFVVLAMVYDSMKYAGKKIKSNLAVFFLLPFWGLVSVIFGVVSFFIRDIEWKVTEHKGLSDE